MDQKSRCWWCGEDPLYVAYHDEEWGVPSHDEQHLFEMLLLEGFQAGLSWITILRKRENFRKAFCSFDAEAIARFKKKDLDRLALDAGIVRNRLKIEAAIANARATVALRDGPRDLPALVWAHAPAAPAPPRERWGDVPAVTPESVALAKALKAAGFRFVGPTTAYATMQAAGLVDDHLASCPVRALRAARGRGAARPA